MRFNSHLLGVEKILHQIMKIRIPNSSIPSGKSGGFRIISYVIIDTKILKREFK